MPQDHYTTLGVDKSASQDEIKKAFRKLAHKHHPDKQGGDEEKFKKINSAYQVIGDEKKRQQYDQFGHSAYENAASGGGADGFNGFSGGAGSGSAWGGQGFNINMDDLGDIFGGMFGGGGSRRQKARGQDIQIDLDLTFKEAIFGVEKEISLTRNVECQRCSGTTAEPGTELKTCSDCNGNGVRMTQHQTVLGVIQQKTTCTTCDGRGEIPETICTSCRGQGTERETSTISVRIPAGVDNGAVMRVGGQGEAIKNGQTGDLYVNLHVEHDKRFQREGSTIISEAQIGFTQAALGDKIEVSTVDGKVDLKIPVGTQSGSKFRLKGKGVPTRHGRGDQYVIVEVVTPKKLSRGQKKLLAELDLKM